MEEAKASGDRGKVCRGHEARGSLPLPRPQQLCVSSLLTLPWEPQEHGSNPTPNSAADQSVAVPKPCSSEPCKGTILRLLRVEVRLQGARPQPRAGGFLPPHRPLPKPSSPDPWRLRAMRLPMTQKGSSPKGHGLTHCSTVETEAQEVATLISHTRKRAVYKHSRSALVTSWGKPGKWGSKNTGFRVGPVGSSPFPHQPEPGIFLKVRAQNSEAWSQPRTV